MNELEVDRGSRLTCGGWIGCIDNLYLYTFSFILCKFWFRIAARDWEGWDIRTRYVYSGKTNLQTEKSLEGQMSRCGFEVR